MKNRYIGLILVVFIILISSCSQNNLVKEESEIDAPSKPLEIKIHTSYGNWTKDIDGEKRSIFIRINGCESNYNQYRNLLPYEERCCGEWGCITTCGPFPEFEEYNAIVDVLLCMCNKTNNNTIIINEIIQYNNISVYNLENNSCALEKMYAI